MTVLEQEERAGTQFGVHWGRETHWGVVPHGGMLDNGEPPVVALSGGYW
jgi:hypothetical protein